MLHPKSTVCISFLLLLSRQVKSASKDKTSLASFAVPDEPLDFDVCVTPDSVSLAYFYIKSRW